ncbi:hypothetical protein ES703_64563 [subsurface metagenome]
MALSVSSAILFSSAKAFAHSFETYKTIVVIPARTNPSPAAVNPRETAHAANPFESIPIHPEIIPRFLTKPGKSITAGPRPNKTTLIPAAHLTKLSLRGLFASVHSLTFTRAPITFSVISSTAGINTVPIFTFMTLNISFS